jgi:hypothetical protein
VSGQTGVISVERKVFRDKGPRVSIFHEVLDLIQREREIPHLDITSYVM